MKKCVYCDNNNVKFSKEHIISKCVFTEVFGKEKRNTTQLFGKFLTDYECTIKDVCVDCNSVLSPYDRAGREFIKLINPYHDASSICIPCDLYTTNWLLKTHLNLLRIFPDKETKMKYEINIEIYERIRKFELFSSNLCKFYVEGWQGADYFWNEESSEKIPYFSYKSIRFIRQKIIVSNFRIKFIDTFFFTPYLNDYENFDERVRSVLEEMRINFGFKLQEVFLGNSSITHMEIANLVSKDTLLKTIEKIYF